MSSFPFFQMIGCERNPGLTLSLKTFSGDVRSGAAKAASSWAKAIKWEMTQNIGTLSTLNVYVFLLPVRSERTACRDNLRSLALLARLCVLKPYLQRKLLLSRVRVLQDEDIQVPVFYTEKGARPRSGEGGY